MEGPAIDKNAAIAYRRVEILSSPYFESSHISANLSGPGMDLVLKILEDLSGSMTAGFKKNSVLKLWNIVREIKDPKAIQAFRRAVKVNVRNPINYYGGAFLSSLMQAVRESKELHKLFNEVCSSKTL